MAMTRRSEHGKEHIAADHVGSHSVLTQSILSPVLPAVLRKHKRPKISLFYTPRPSEMRILKTPLLSLQNHGTDGTIED